MQDHRQLDIWQRAMDYTVDVYSFSTLLPTDERFSLVKQLRKAAISVTLNVAEGCGCATRPEFARFLSYAYRSVKEVMTGVELSVRLYPSVSGEAAEALVTQGDELARMTYSLMQRLAPDASLVGTED